MAKFDSKTWNPTVFEKYRKKVPSAKENSLIKNGVLNRVTNTRARLTDEVGGNYIIEPIKGLLDGQVLNYDGVVDMTATSRDTFEQGKIIVGRMKAWTEKDFSTELTGEDWIKGIAAEVNEYYDGVDQDTLLSILKGIFAMNDGSGFINAHVSDISGTGDGMVSATSLNSALQKASGDKKKLFKVAFMHSMVATNLENLNLLEFLKYTDKDGVQRDLGLATYNGKLVVIDDEMPTSETVTTAPVYSTTISTAASAGDKITIAGTEYTFVANSASDTGNKIKVGADGTAAQQAANIVAKITLTGFTITQGTSSNNNKVIFTAASGTNPDAPVVTAEKASEGTIVVTNATDTPAVVVTKYDTYVMGEKFFDYDNVGVRVPNEMNRDPKTNGGLETLYTRQRKLFVPKWISFTKASMSSNSPTDAELATGANWEVVNNGKDGADKRFVNHKMIPLAKVISKG